MREVFRRKSEVERTSRIAESESGAKRGSCPPRPNNTAIYPQVYRAVTIPTDTKRSAVPTPAAGSASSSETVEDTPIASVLLRLLAA